MCCLKALYVVEIEILCYLRELHAVNQKLYNFFLYYLSYCAASMDFIVIVKINVSQNKKWKKKRNEFTSRDNILRNSHFYSHSLCVKRATPSIPNGFEYICFYRSNFTQYSRTTVKKIASTESWAKLCYLLHFV